MCENFRCGNMQAPQLQEAKIFSFDDVAFLQHSPQLRVLRIKDDQRFGERPGEDKQSQKRLMGLLQGGKLPDLEELCLNALMASSEVLCPITPLASSLRILRLTFWRKPGNSVLFQLIS